jgi:hypothetical protein
MKTKRSKRKLCFILALLIIVAIAYIIYVQNKSSELGEANYGGSNHSFSISFTRYVNYEAFIKAKSPNIYIYDSEKELKELNFNNGFIAGELEIKITDESMANNKDDLQNCKIELFRKSGWNISSSALYLGESQGSVIKLPFIAYDYDDSKGNIYENAIIKIGKNEIPVELKNSN